MLNNRELKPYRFALQHLGFRPFFLLAGVFALFSMLLWMWLYQTNQSLPQAQVLANSIWHAHEMIYGYSVAVIAGFLLTAVRNWTGVQTLHGAPLLVLASLWLLARVMPLVNHPDALYLMAAFDLLFNLTLSASVLYPIIKVRQWSQIGVWSKLLLLFIANGLFYLGLFGQVDQGMQWGLYAGLYLIISLILMMARRVVPFFIEKGVDEASTLINYRWVDISSLILMLIFIVVEVFLSLPVFSAVIALLLFIVHAIRLAGWYTPGIWRKPLLWILYLAYAWIVFGFAMKGAGLFITVEPMLAVHAFAVGGVGLVTLGMMARVILGHTGRDVFDPPPILTLIFLILVVGSVLRVLLPMLLPDLYLYWIGLSQACWITSFGLFVWLYTPMLIKSRVDGNYG